MTARALPGIPIHAQRAELATARAGGYTIEAWIDGPGVDDLEAQGDHELMPGIRVLATSGHSPSHQSLVVDRRAGPVVLTGQAICGLDEWRGTPGREGRTAARDRRRATPRSTADVVEVRPGREPPRGTARAGTSRPGRRRPAAGVSRARASPPRRGAHQQRDRPPEPNAAEPAANLSLLDSTVPC